MAVDQMDIGGWLFEMTPFQAAKFLITAHLISALTVYAVVKHTKPGFNRFLGVLPSVVLCLFTPCLFDRKYVITRILTFFSIAWLASFKILQVSINRGPLADTRMWRSLLQFSMVLLMPITPTIDESSSTKRGRLAEELTRSQMATNWLGKWAMLGGVLIALQYNLPKILEAFLYGLALYALLTLVMDGPGAIATMVGGIKVSPHFDRPWTAKSINWFWNKNWDLAAGNALRQLIYEPITEGKLIATPTSSTAPTSTTQTTSGDTTSSPSTTTTTSETTTPITTSYEGITEPPASIHDTKKSTTSSTATAHRPSSLRQLIGATASFGTSGLVHEGALWYIGGKTSRGRVSSFFLVQVPAIIIERAVLAFCRKHGIEVPRVVRTMWVVTFEVWASMTFFWAPLIEMGVIDRAISSLGESYLGAVDSVRDLRNNVWLSSTQHHGYTS